MSGAQVPWGRLLVASAGIIGVGYAVMKATTPTEQQFYDALSPDLKRQVDHHREAAKRKAALQEQLERAKTGEADSAPVWAAGRSGRDSSPPPRQLS
ncbi:unnamed protein product [Tilletia controversa]|uniref:Cytochrome b mRNA-processing protein 4 n=3 Tax=Tilletia TaxID=13289 RepID=A0A8X7MUT1_9BASI|nr:hypothetical protein CF336_g3842 [Tilletia laevis]KAE8198614.1 hypothetical protein CF328_g3501 [Tilletia controversa]KAE8261481.1 hypothetical protein A4X03_0g3216 [Tilletia caries]KAE8197409.1 hypothetical protein CF335_g4621 [Tilletia laevis]KAE8249407.1 hypothetical protein A4X06_0g3245 [Tilletia controversa]